VGAILQRVLAGLRDLRGLAIRVAFGLAVLVAVAIVLEKQSSWAAEGQTNRKPLVASKLSGSPPPITADFRPCNPFFSIRDETKLA
jgi:hypothetical protein